MRAYLTGSRKLISPSKIGSSSLIRLRLISNLWMRPFGFGGDAALTLLVFSVFGCPEYWISQDRSLRGIHAQQLLHLSFGFPWDSIYSEIMTQKWSFGSQNLKCFEENPQLIANCANQWENEWSETLWLTYRYTETNRQGRKWKSHPKGWTVHVWCLKKSGSIIPFGLLRRTESNTFSSFLCPNRCRAREICESFN